MAARNRSIDITQIIEWQDGMPRRVQDYLTAEEPLEMRAGRRSLGVTPRTPGNDSELVAGFLFTKGIITQPAQLLSIEAADDLKGNSASNQRCTRDLGPGAIFRGRGRPAGFPQGQPVVPVVKHRSRSCGSAADDVRTLHRDLIPR